MSFRKVVSDFQKLSLADKLSAAEEISKLAERARKLRADELERELATLRGGRKVAPKYRSLKDPSKTWAGRGAKPNWLVEEMKSSKKKIDAFKI